MKARANRKSNSKNKTTRAVRGRNGRFRGMLTMIDTTGDRLRLRIERPRGADVLAEGSLLFLPAAARSLRRRVELKGRTLARPRSRSAAVRIRLTSLTPAAPKTAREKAAAKRAELLRANDEFRNPPSIEELARRQGVGPFDASRISDELKEAFDDEFMQILEEIRHPPEEERA